MTNKKSWIKLGKSSFRRIGISLICGYFLMVILMFFGQRAMMYFPTHYDVPPRGVLPFEPWLNQHREFLGYVRSGTAPKRVVVFFHGNAGEALDRSWLNELVASPDVAVVLAEHPGYGAKPGSANEESLIDAGHRLLEATRLRWKAPITILGESLGTGVACAVAGDAGVDRLALISPFASTLDVARRNFGHLLPTSLLLKDTYRSDLRLQGLRVPLQIIHGIDDDVVPIASGQLLFQGYAGPKQLTLIRGAKHNDMVPFLLKAREAEDFRRFVQGTLDDPPSK